MNPKLKKLLDARAAWMAGVRSKAAEDEIKKLYGEVQKAQAEVDQALASGEITDADVAKAAAPASGGKAAEPPTPDNVIDVDEFKKALEAMVGKAVKDNLPADLHPQVTPESIKAAIADALKAQGSAKGLDKEAMQTTLDAAVKAQLKSIKVGGKFLFDLSPGGAAGGGNARGGGQVEIPFSYTGSKENLPLHARQLLNVMMRQPVNHGIPESMIQDGEAKGKAMLDKYHDMARRGVKALTSTGAGTGDELVPTSMSAELQRRFYLASDLAALMVGREIDMPTNPYVYPLITTRPTFLLESVENTAATASDPGTAGITLNAKKVMGRVDFSYEVEEDAIIPVLNDVQTLLGEAGAAAYEDALINGDTTPTHMDSDTDLVAKHAARAFKGFRKLALAAAASALIVDLSTGGINEANLRSMKKRLGKYGVRTRDLVWIVGSQGKADMEGITNVSTLEKYGPRATILTGELSSFLGVPIITSEKARENLNASGVYDGVTLTKGSIILANLSQFKAGRRRDFTVEVDKDIKTQSWILVAAFRRDFVPAEVPSATVPSVVLGYNYDA